MRRFFARDSPIPASSSAAFRQREPAFLDLLNHIRNDQATAGIRGFEQPDVALAGKAPDEAIVMSATNAIAKRINTLGLETLPGQAFTYQATLAGRLKEKYDEIIRYGGIRNSLSAHWTRASRGVHLTLKPAPA